MANQTRQLARLLEGEGAHVEIIATNAPYRPSWIGRVRGVRALFRLVPYVLRLWRAAGGVQLFHVMANSGWAWYLLASPAVFVAKLRRIPVVVNYRGGDAAEFFSRSFFWRVAMWMSDRRVVPSGYLHQVFQRFGVSADVVPNIIDLARFQPRSSKPAARVDGPHIVVARHLEPLYDIGTAIRAFAAVRAKQPGARLTIAGGGPERDKLLMLVRELGVAEQVQFVGRLDNELIASLYRDADVFMNSSLHDNMPISFLEALACGVPIVSTDVCGIPFLVEHQKTALLVPPRDPTAMADAVLYLLDNPGVAERLICNGRELAQRYTWNQVRPTLFHVYSKVIDPARTTQEAGVR
jgi:glycosyltransferase involved in cell wall biosynthesis